jgi:hypothetical protein
VDWKRSGLVIRDRSALEKLADFPDADTFEMQYDLSKRLSGR